MHFSLKFEVVIFAVLKQNYSKINQVTYTIRTIEPLILYIEKYCENGKEKRSQMETENETLLLKKKIS